MVPDLYAVRVRLQIFHQPVAGTEEFLARISATVLPVQIEIPQAPLRDGDRIVLLADAAVIIQNGNAAVIVRSVVASLHGKIHVVPAKPRRRGTGIQLSLAVPETELDL